MASLIIVGGVERRILSVRNMANLKQKLEENRKKKKINKEKKTSWELLQMEWLHEYHQSRPGLKVLQQRIDDFINAHEEKLEQEREEREAEAAKDGWTVVVHHKGRNKLTDSESGITVGSVAPAVAKSMSAKKSNEVKLDFYRFQKRDAQRNEILALQNKFEQDRKRILQLRAGRKCRP